MWVKGTDKDMLFTKVTNLNIRAYSEHPEVYHFSEWLVNDYMSTKERVRDQLKKELEIGSHIFLLLESSLHQYGLEMINILDLPRKFITLASRAENKSG